MCIIWSTLFLYIQLRIMEMKAELEMKMNQEEIDNWKVDMKKAETIDSSMGAVEKITLINQICKCFLYY